MTTTTDYNASLPPGHVDCWVEGHGIQPEDPTHPLGCPKCIEEGTRP